LHGITSHGGWYNRSCDHLAAAGIEVHFLDRRGSGLNSEAPGDIDDWQTWIDDVRQYLEKLRASTVDLTPDTRAEICRGENLTPTLCGISWGGKLAAAVARKYPHLLGGLGLICPGLYSPHGPGLLKRLFLAGPLPKRLRRRRVRIPLEEPSLFTERPPWQDYVATDPLTLRKVTVRFAREDRRLTQFARQAAPYLHLPALLVLAGRDRIVANGKTRAFFNRLAGPHKTFIEYPNAAHTLEFEPDPSQYYADLATWIKTAAGAPERKC
jgi:alpha-beta hydrolase superfamily lysophospholipase